MESDLAKLRTAESTFAERAVAQRAKQCYGEDISCFSLVAVEHHTTLQTEVLGVAFWLAGLAGSQTVTVS